MLVSLLTNGPLRELWLDLDVSLISFSELGLAGEASDREVWEICQDFQVVLITANRNSEGDDSLEATIRARGDQNILPVITLADEQRIMRDRDYAEKTAESVLDYLAALERYRGVGRLYVP